MFQNCYKFNQEVRTWNPALLFTGNSTTVNMFYNANEMLTNDDFDDYISTTPGVLFWREYRNQNQPWRYGHEITSTTIDGTVTTSYDYIPLDL